MVTKAAPAGKPIPVILDTDIGTDIDDTWALVMMLNSPELDVRLIVTDTDDTVYRARIVAKILQIAGRTDIPIGVGLQLSQQRGPQEPWVKDYDLAQYPGPVHHDGVGALIDTIMDSSDPVTLISIGPVPNISAALAREPRIAARARFVGMHGSIRRGYDGSPQIAAEYNVKRYPQSCQQVFTAPWEMTITPLDTCGLVRLRGDKYARVRDCKRPLAQALIENYRTWAGYKEVAEQESSVLFDTVAVYLAMAQDLLTIERLGVRVTDEGFTVLDDRAKQINCATEWKDLLAFEDLLVERLTR